MVQTLHFKNEETEAQEGKKEGLHVSVLFAFIYLLTDVVHWISPQSWVLEKQRWIQHKGQYVQRRARIGSKGK